MGPLMERLLCDKAGEGTSALRSLTGHTPPMRPSARVARSRTLCTHSDISKGPSSESRTCAGSTGNRAGGRRHQRPIGGLDSPGIRLIRIGGFRHAGSARVKGAKVASRGLLCAGGGHFRWKV